MNKPPAHLFLSAALTLAFLAPAPHAAAQDAKPAAPGESKPAPTLKAGDKAPAIAVESFLKGDPVTAFAPGRVYVVEFWATWCGPCVAMFPHLSELQAHYRDQGLSILGVNVWEEPTYTEKTPAIAREFVEKQTSKGGMAYTVAYDGAAKFMDTHWMQASGRKGIPSAFVVDGMGTVAWIGHPIYLDYVLDKVMHGTWSVESGPREIKAAEEAMDAALATYTEGYEAGEKAWKGAAATNPLFVPMYADQRYGAMLGAGHDTQAYALGREMFVAAKAKKDSAALMGVVTPMMNKKNPPKTIDRRLALDVANAVYELGDPTQYNRHVSQVQIYLMLGDTEKANEHKVKALELVPAARKAGLERWFTQMEEAATKK